MKLLAFTVYDEKAECFGHPFFVSAPGIATRFLQEWVNNENSMIGKHPGDFTLYHIGFWLDHEAKFENLQTPTFIAKGTDSILKEQNLEPPQLREVDKNA